VAGRYNYKLVGHRLDLYGVCPNCAAKFEEYDQVAN
jgi:Fe2+ or Zn2+ uptake regulation protein